jgi:hypothetical protein
MVSFGRRGVVAVLAAVIALGSGSLGLTAATAADATGCSGQATSFDDAGVPIDTAQAPGTGATQADPLDLLWAGTIEWSGQTDEAIQDGSYRVTITPQRGGALFGWAVSQVSGRALSGPVDNEDAKTEASGTVVPSDVSGLRRMVTGTYKVEWTVSGAAASCTGAGFIKVVDDPTGSVTWWVALILILFGFTGLLLARPVARPTKG